jgi:DNA polymerase-4
MTTTVRRILHCDMDCFYAAVHVRDDPALRGRPVVVGGDPAGRGVVAAASYEARRHGIHSAMPAAQARRLCPDAVFLRPDFARTIYREFTPIIEPMSLDEAYLDVSQYLGDFGSATEIAREIRRRVWRQRRLTVSVGVAANKLVAKIASDFDKPDGLTVVRPSEVADFLAPLPVRRLHGIGPATEQSLRALGVTTVSDLRALSLDSLLDRFGHWGRALWRASRGLDDRSVQSQHARKSLSTERTFANDVSDLAAMDEILAEMSSEVAGSLERRRLAAYTVFVKVRYPDFTTLTRSHTFATPVSSSAAISECAYRLLRRTEAARRSVRLLGVGTSGLVSTRVEQLPLFEGVP